MKGVSVSKEKVIWYVKQHKVVQTSELSKYFNCTKKTIFRILKTKGYLTSYNKNSSGLTLLEIPKFNKYGLWEYRGFRFSRCRNLKETIYYLVNNSEAGLTAGELCKLLYSNIYHHISYCVDEGMIIRDTTWRFPIYYSMNRQKRQQQQKARDNLLRALSQQSHPYLSKDKIIQILVLAVKYHITSVEKLMPILISEGLRVSEKGVRRVFEKYKIEKKGSP